MMMINNSDDDGDHDCKLKQNNMMIINNSDE
jgi:hypothetical protein